MLVGEGALLSVHRTRYSTHPLAQRDFAANNVYVYAVLEYRIRSKTLER
jgi:hypothetical protein